ncbi:MAG: glycosyltransferase family 2 protein [Candidatus Niyogibacteria bacterium]|nr:glycosyltransferase family 2 protein [Candidatus Niyogibacteria bacterium]
MKLSFIIPAYNEEHYIGKCLASITEQCRAGKCDVEVIVVNNASTDRTSTVAASFPEVRVVYEPKKGIVRARRAGYLASTGELIANIDADTILSPGWLDKVFREFNADPALAALSGPYIYHDLFWFSNLLTRMFYYLGHILHTFGRYILRRKNAGMLQGGNFIIRRTALEAIGGYDTSIEFYGEDTDIARRASAVGRVHFTFDLPMYTSGRRLKKEGVITMGVKYGINHLWVLFFEKPFTREYIDIRPPRKN